MNNQFNFSSENAARILNYLNGCIDSYKLLGNDLFSDTLKHRNSGRIEALTDTRDFIEDVFRVCGLEIIELEAEEVEKEMWVERNAEYLQCSNGYDD